MPGPGRGPELLCGQNSGQLWGNGLAVRVGACEGPHKVAAAAVSRYETPPPQLRSEPAQP